MNYVYYPLLLKHFWHCKFHSVDRVSVKADKFKNYWVKLYVYTNFAFGKNVIHDTAELFRVLETKMYYESVQPLKFYDYPLVYNRLCPLQQTFIDYLTSDRVA